MKNKEILKMAYEKSYLCVDKNKGKSKTRRFIWYKSALELLPDLKLKNGHPYRFSWFIWNLYNPNDMVNYKSGYNIHHRDEDTLNDGIKNLEKIEHGKHASQTQKDNKNAIGNKSNKGKTGNKSHMYGRKNPNLSIAMKEYWRRKKEFV